MEAVSFRTLAAATACLLLSACGGGGGGSGGGVESTPPPPPPPPPPPSNSDITNLVASGPLANDSSSSQTGINLDSGATGKGTVAGKALTISYNAAANSYTVAVPGVSSTFLPTDRKSNVDGEARYQRNSATGSPEYLTLVTTPYGGTKSNRYVGLGFWQRNAVSAGTQQTDFDIFAYGLDTPVASVPKSGRASWETDVFGLYTSPTATPRTIQGTGDFTVDFASGHFTTSTALEQFDFLTGGSVTGGGIYLESRGRLGSGNSFSGAVSYQGSLTSVAGTLEGRFYGPGAEEIGATFRADNATGATLVGALTGQRKASATPANFTLSNLVKDELFYSLWAILDQAAIATPTYSVSSPSIGQTTFRPDGSFGIATPSSDMPYANFTEQDRLSSGPAGFASYEKSVNGSPLRVELYRPTSPALTLTYAGFGTWERTMSKGTMTVPQLAYFQYGLVTERGLLSRRTGTASYDGVAYGSAGVEGVGRFSIGGTSRFDVDFGKQSFTGSLSLTATPPGGSTANGLGTWQFGAPLSYGLLVSTPLIGGTANGAFNVINPAFYGPSGEEIAATFAIQFGATIDGRNASIVGATVAKRN